MQIYLYVTLFFLFRVNGFSSDLHLSGVYSIIFFGHFERWWHKLLKSNAIRCHFSFGFISWTFSIYIHSCKSNCYRWLIEMRQLPIHFITPILTRWRVQTELPTIFTQFPSVLVVRKKMEFAGKKLRMNYWVNEPRCQFALAVHMQQHQRTHVSRPRCKSQLATK